MESSVDIPTKRGHINFKYADLPSIHKIVKPIINNNNFMLTYAITCNSVPCVLYHINGEIFDSEIEFKPDQDPKNSGAKITYYKRYALSALLAIDTEEDKDAKFIQQKPEWWREAINYLRDGGHIDNITKKYNLSDGLKDELIADSVLPDDDY